MTQSLALAHLVVAAASNRIELQPAHLLSCPLLAIGVLGYFFFIRPQQRKAQAAAGRQGSGIEVGDEVQTVGGVIGTVLEIHGDRYTLLTGALGDDGNLDGPQPTRIVFVRQAIAKKIEPVEDVAGRRRAGRGRSASQRHEHNGVAATAPTSDIDDVGGDGAATSGEHGGEAEEA